MSGAAFHRGRPFLGRESTRWMERSRSGLQVQGSGAVSEHSCWLRLNCGTSAFSSAVLGSSGCGAAPGSHSLKGKGGGKAASWCAVRSDEGSHLSLWIGIPEDVTEGRLTGSCLPLRARDSLPLWVWDRQATGVTEEEGKSGERRV
ncbi:uncharacterized protein VSU04_005084 [Chlamydotis macqueenii]